MELKRGDLVIVSAPGSHGKPRLSVVLQSNAFSSVDSLTVLLMTTELRPDIPLLRHRVIPSETNGLVSLTDIMIDKLFTIPRKRMGQRIGHLSSSEMAEVTAAVAVFLGM